MASEEMIFLFFLCVNLSFWLPFSGLDKIHKFGKGILKEHFCKTFVKISAVR